MDEWAGMTQPKCPDCGVVMRDDPRGFWCEYCRHLDDHSAELATVVLPPDFEGPDISR